MPLWQGLIGVALVVALALAVSGDDAVLGRRPRAGSCLLIYVLGFGGTMLGCIAARAADGPRGCAPRRPHRARLRVLHWLLWPVLVRSAVRQLTERRDWVKTEREPLEPPPQARVPGGIPRGAGGTPDHPVRT